MKLLIPYSSDDVVAKQPEACKNCFWGSWNGNKQFCSKPKCIKE